MAASAIAGVRIGHVTDLAGGTGCTVVLTPEGARCGVAVRGAAPGLREVATFTEGHLVDTVHAVVLTGGSAFGLGVADGVMRWLAERGFGYDTGLARVPIVPTAVLFDLACGDASAFPSADDGYAACENATSDFGPMGNIGAGTGATVGKVFGPTLAMKGGFGHASITMGNGVTVAALVAVNALGDVRDPQTQTMLAGARKPNGNGFLDTAQTLIHQPYTGILGLTNTTLGVLLTDAECTKDQGMHVAQMAHNGFARAIHPVHTLYDGDTIFALSCGTKTAHPVALGTAATEVMAQAIVNALRAAEPLHGFPAASA